MTTSARTARTRLVPGLPAIGLAALDLGLKAWAERGLAAGSCWPGLPRTSSTKPAPASSPTTSIPDGSPTFNGADVLITIGAIGMIAGVLRPDPNEKGELHARTQ